MNAPAIRLRPKLIVIAWTIPIIASCVGDSPAQAQARREEARAAEPSAGAGPERFEGPHALETAGARLALDPADGAAIAMESTGPRGKAVWLHDRLSLRAIRHGTAEAASPTLVRGRGDTSSLHVERHLAGREIDLALEERWTRTPSGFAWDLSFRGPKPRAGHDIIIEIPALSPDRAVFTPTERGAMSLAAHPTFEPAPYGSVGWDSRRYYVLPLVTVLDRSAGAGLTIALPPDAPIPHLQVSWEGARLLRMRLGNRAIGGGPDARVRLLFFHHQDDRRDAIRAYSDAFPDWFRPYLPRGPHEGTFWYHHVQAHPDFEEMHRQDVRFLWASFWFTHLGEYLPEGKEWHPYTFARWWKLGETMTDEKIRAFVRELRERGIGTFAYFNVTEYGGAGGAAGDEAEAARILRERFADALIRREDGQPIPTWEGALAMNCDPSRSLFPVLREQVQRHLDRLPEIDGFCIDRLDWGSIYDYGHGDGITRIGERDAECMAGPVGRGVAEVCRLAHGAGKRVYVNQFWRIEMLRDVDGYCHESDYVLGLGYLSPYRPVSAWHHQKPYSGDLLAFEAQLKLRLLNAVFPQMVAREFPISQQAPDPEAAELLEVYSPLFSKLHGKEQVLLPHCVEVPPPDDANLFRIGDGRHAAVVISRARFLSRAGGAASRTTLSLRFPGVERLTWAHVHSADVPPYRAEVRGRDERAEVVIERHGTASLVVMGTGAEPEMDLRLAASAAAARERLFPGAGKPAVPVARSEGGRASSPPAPPPETPPGPTASGPEGWVLLVRGAQVGCDGTVEVSLGGEAVGTFTGRGARLDLPPRTAPLEASGVSEVTFSTGDEGTWFVPESVRLLARLSPERRRLVAAWATGDDVLGAPGGALRLRLRPCEPRENAAPAARFTGRDDRSGGRWRGRIGRVAAWLAGAPERGAPEGFRLEAIEGRPFTWAAETADGRVLEPREPAGEATAAGPRASTCWFADASLAFAIAAPPERTYRLTVYILDFDRNGRSVLARVRGDLEDEEESQEVSREEAARGTYLTWVVTGPATLEVEKVDGFNAVASGIFIDPE